MLSLWQQMLVKLSYTRLAKQYAIYYKMPNINTTAEISAQT